MRFVTVVLGLVVLVLGGLYFLKNGLAPGGRTAPLPRLWQVTDFHLTERSGAPVTRADLQGKVWLADLFYTTCPGPCPLLSKRFAELQQALSGEPDVRLVSLTSDPATDLPAALREYAARYGAGERWLFLTGAPDDVFAFARNQLKLAVAEDPSSKEQPITHGTKFILFDRIGWARGLYDGLGGDNRTLERDVHRLVQETP